MKTDDFEKRLLHVAPRKVPSAWREEILATAQQAEDSHRSSSVARPRFLATLIRQLSTLSRPQRAAWAGLVTVWLLIALMNLSARDTATDLSHMASMPSPESLQAMRREKIQLLAELNGQPLPRAVDRTKPNTTGPHSQRRETGATA